MAHVSRPSNPDTAEVRIEDFNHRIRDQFKLFTKTPGTKQFLLQIIYALYLLYLIVVLTLSRRPVVKEGAVSDERYGSWFDD